MEDDHSPFTEVWLVWELECCGGGGDFLLDFLGKHVFWWVFCQNLIDLISMDLVLLCY